MSQSSELCVITTPDSRSSGAAAQYGRKGARRRHTIPVGVREIFPTASSMINRLARAASLSLLSLRPLLVHTCCSGKESDGMTTHFKQAIFPESIHFLFWMLSAVCDVTKGSKVLSKFSDNTWAEVPQDGNDSYSIMCVVGGVVY